jgi:hypothetical protein
MSTCNCIDWQPCPCGNQGPEWHCMYCCLDLSEDQMRAFDFDQWEHIPYRPKSLPLSIACGCGLEYTNPTQEEFDNWSNHKCLEVR